MLKFAPRNNTHFRLPIKKEKNIKIYKWLLTLPGKFKSRKINTVVWKYLLTYHMYYKPFSSFSNFRYICSFTGRARAVYRDFHLARIEVKKAIGAGFFFGFSKSSW